MIGVRRGDEGPLAGVNALDQMTQAAQVIPGGIGFGDALPGAGGTLPEFVAVGRPVIPLQTNRAGRAIEFQGGVAVALNREAAGDDGQGGVAKVQDELGVVFGFNRNPFSGNHPFGNGDAHQGRYASHRAKPTGQAGDVVDRQIKEGSAARQTVIPRPP